MPDGTFQQQSDSCVELLRWSVVSVDGHVSIALDGQLDLSNVSALHTALIELANMRPATVTVDLEHLSFLDSSGIQCLLDAAECAAAAGYRLVARRPTATVLRVLTICGVDDVLLGHSIGDAFEDR